MKKEVLIKIKGIQVIDGEKSTTELFTLGNMYKKNDSYFLSYKESETTGFEGCNTILKIEGNEKVTLIRNGAMRSHLVAQQGMRNIGYYDTIAGQVQIGTYTKSITNTLNDEGGDVYFSYDLDINSSEVSENEVYINVTRD
ncbi:MAG: DUF1934 domain-containing protein [Oscillospiraceae bacterium]